MLPAEITAEVFYITYRSLTYEVSSEFLLYDEISIVNVLHIYIKVRHIIYIYLQHTNLY
jgi:hypothetical protein